MAVWSMAAWVKWILASAACAAVAYAALVLVDEKTVSADGVTSLITAPDAPIIDEILDALQRSVVEVPASLICRCFVASAIWVSIWACVFVPLFRMAVWSMAACVK